MTVPKSCPALLLSRPTTFSSTSHWGRISSAMRQTSQKRPVRAPARPALAPMLLTSWQGNPAVMTSTRARLCAPAVRTSSCRWALGKCRASTSRQSASSSTCQAVCTRRAQSRGRIRRCRRTGCQSLGLWGLLCQLFACHSWRSSITWGTRWRSGVGLAALKVLMAAHLGHLMLR